MSALRKAAEQALEAIVAYGDSFPFDEYHNVKSALLTALAEPDEVAAAVAAEREACARVCEVHGSMAKHAVWMAEECAALIRARGNDE